ncbi:hypothetical protein ASG62_24570 [Aureimonas sp. Leaf427]|nr:hypothetical protein ASG62_24570 [Aureimonas sp. Leaf427]
MVAAMNRSMAMIQFDPNGQILMANENFLRTMGYELSEVIGKHHSMFAEPVYASSKSYQQFWDRLGGGEFISDEFKRLGKNGREVWIQASYNPVFDRSGRVIKVVKFASDITEAKTVSITDAGKIAAITRAQAMIEFDTAGNILHANQNFLDALGYGLDEIVGQHHSMFVEPAFAASV